MGFQVTGLIVGRSQSHGWGILEGLTCDLDLGSLLPLLRMWSRCRKRQAPGSLFPLDNDREQRGHIPSGSCPLVLQER